MSLALLYTSLKKYRRERAQSYLGDYIFGFPVPAENLYMPAKFVFFRVHRTSLSISVRTVQICHGGFKQFYGRKLAEELKMINTSWRAIQLLRHYQLE